MVACCTQGVREPWSKVKGASGYYIDYNNTKNEYYSNDKVSNTNSYIIRRVAAGTYKIRVKAFKKVNGKKYYGKYSSTKTVTIKKSAFRTWNIGADARDTIYSVDKATAKVKATLYNNGLLEVTGTGDTCDMGGVGTPMWAKYDWMLSRAKIEKTVQTTNMDFWFKGCYMLTTVDRIPSTVESMESTFSECDNLLRSPDLPDTLTDMSSTFEDCWMSETPTIPKHVELMNDTFAGCDISVAPTIPDSVTQMNGTFAGSYIKVAPKIPDNVNTMIATFESCLYLTTAPSYIPEHVSNITELFTGCIILRGNVLIKGDPQKCNYCVESAGYFAGKGKTFTVQYYKGKWSKVDDIKAQVKADQYGSHVRFEELAPSN